LKTKMKVKIESIPIIVKNNELIFGDPNSIDHCKISFQRTLRIPDDGKIYPLPPSFGNFPIEKVDDYKDKVPKDWIEHGGVFIPMYQREAMWMQFNAQTSYPKAVKIAVGKVNALSGETWDQKLNKKENDYVVIPDQPWLDGINNGNGTIKQFIAMPLGEGYTVEEQVTGKAEFGGIQLCVYDAKEHKKQYSEKFDKEYQDIKKHEKKKNLPIQSSYLNSISISEEQSYKKTSDLFSNPSAPQLECCDFSSEEMEMGIGSGGKMKQKIYKDKYGYGYWNESKIGRIFVHIVNSTMYEKITGKKTPSTPIDVHSYKSYQYPWFDIYDENKSSIKKSNILQNVSTVKEIDQQKYMWPQEDNSTVFINGQQVINLKPKINISYC